MILVILLFSSATLVGCKGSSQNTFNTDNFQQEEYKYTEDEIIPAAERTAIYHPLIKSKKIAVVVNQTSLVGQHHLVDTLRMLGVQIVKIFAPEHGYAGKADAGKKIEDGKHADTPIISLYGKKKKPLPADLQGVDAILFDIQDVGARFYTYISTLHNVMEAGAENNIPVIVLDRPNPNGFYVDGPVLEQEYASFVGMHPVPVVYGMTIGEYAQMINGEGWLNDNVECDLTVIECKGYDHTMTYALPVKPSPNLPNLKSILLYPSLCLFEGTTVSVGRGTDMQFQLTGHPALQGDMPYSFTPVSKSGATNPKHKGITCYGMEFHHMDTSTLLQDASLNLDFLIKYYSLLTAKGESFFLETGFFDKLAGTDKLRKQILAGKTSEEIKATWQNDINTFKVIRAKYLLYP